MALPTYKSGDLVEAWIPGNQDETYVLPNMLQGSCKVLIISNKQNDGFKNPGCSYLVYILNKQQMNRVEDYQILRKLN